MNPPVEIFPSEREKLYDRFADKLETANNLSRKVVSFQANNFLSKNIFKRDSL